MIADVDGILVAWKEHRSELRPVGHGRLEHQNNKLHLINKQHAVHKYTDLLHACILLIIHAVRFLIKKLILLMMVSLIKKEFL